MNILILSAGTRNKIVQYFRRELAGTGRVIATDMQAIAPAIYDADAFYLVPRITAPDYIEQILDICRKERVDGVLSLIDPELSLLAENSERSAAIGTQVIGSPTEQCERALDKWLMYLWLREHGYACAETFLDFPAFEEAAETGRITFPVFVKPRFGSASIAISKADDLDTARFLFQRQPDMIVQEFLHGQEIGADCYIDMVSQEVVSIFTKKKLLMRAGETDKAVSFRDRELFALVERFARESGYLGQIDVDIFDVGGVYYISEVNPRFGGGYPHAYESGVNHMHLIVNNLNGHANKPCIGAYDEGIVMMKYNELKILMPDEKP